MAAAAPPVGSRLGGSSCMPTTMSLRAANAEAADARMAAAAKAARNAVFKDEPSDRVGRPGILAKSAESSMHGCVATAAARSRDTKSAGGGLPDPEAGDK